MTNSSFHLSKREIRQGNRNFYNFPRKFFFVSEVPLESQDVSMLVNAGVITGYLSSVTNIPFSVMLSARHGSRFRAIFDRDPCNDSPFNNPGALEALGIHKVDSGISFVEAMQSQMNYITLELRSVEVLQALVPSTKETTDVC